MPEDIHNVAAFIGSSGMPISDALARAAPFLVSNGEVSWVTHPRKTVPT